VKPFDAAFVINLHFKNDRLEKFREAYPESFLGELQVWRAVHGDTVQHPSWWTAGRGAWGCYRSHMQILEHAWNMGYESYLVFEDDAVFAEDFSQALCTMMQSIPDDWDQAYLGGQLLYEIEHPPKRVSPHWLIPYNVNRTHCFAVHRRGYSKLYEHLLSLPFHEGEHIDHHLGRLHECRGVNVYVPERWIVGQDAGWSNISGKENDENWWHHPGKLATEHVLYTKPEAIFLKASREVAEKLQEIGWHQGRWKNSDGLDNGVCQAISSSHPEENLKRWYEWVQREVVRDDMVLPCLYHPSVTAELLGRFRFARWHMIEAESVEDAIKQLEEKRSNVL
jgi:GR25 family glycosyltransferase involved in LPS biosynthesis